MTADLMAPLPVQAEKLLKRLETLWVEMGKAQGENALVRACSMTLIVATTDANDASGLTATLGDLMHTHPARMIVLRVVQSAEPVLQAQVNAHCQLAFGGRKQICCEIIEISATVDRLQDVYATVLGLTMPDLPVVLWLKDPALFLEPAMQKLRTIARTVLLDSARLGPALLPEMAKAKREGWRIKDLAWTRLTVWRETISQAFDNACVRDMAKATTACTIGHATQPSNSGLYLKAWLSARLPQASIGFVQTDAARKGSLQFIQFDSPDHRVTVRAMDDANVAILVDKLESRILAPARSESDLVNEELAIMGIDPTFEETLELTANSGTTN